jgi:uncharacterized membrane protein
MADYDHPVVNPSPSTELARSDGPVSAALLAYALFGVSAAAALISAGGIVVAAPLVGLLGIIGVIVCYVKRDEAQGTWVASHFRWLIRTFWYSLLWSVIGGIIFVLLFIVFLLGPILAWFIWGAASIWVLYRVIRGYLLFKDSKPIPAM